MTAFDNGNGTVKYSAQICLGIAPNFGGTDIIIIDADVPILNSDFTPSVSTNYKYCDMSLGVNGGNCLSSSGTFMGAPPAGGTITTVSAIATGSVSGGNLIYNGSQNLAPGDVYAPAGDCNDCYNPPELCFNVTFLTIGQLSHVQLIGAEQYNGDCGGTCCPDEFDNTIPFPNGNLSATASTNEDNGTCSGNATISVSGGVGPYTYLWSTNDTTSFINGLCSGTYTCTVTDMEGDSISITVVIFLTNISKIGEKQISLTVFPNPGTGILTLNVSNQEQQLYVFIFNLLGEIIYQSELPGTESTSKIDISNNDPGIYYLQIATKSGNSVPIKIILN